MRLESTKFGSWLPLSQLHYCSTAGTTINQDLPFGTGGWLARRTLMARGLLDSMTWGARAQSSFAAIDSIRDTS
jgi:hypothetical protein